MLGRKITAAQSFEIQLLHGEIFFKNYSIISQCQCQTKYHLLLISKQYKIALGVSDAK